MMFQLTDAFMTGRPPAFWNPLRGMPATEPTIKRFHDALAEHTRKLDAIMARVEAGSPAKGQSPGDDLPRMQLPISPRTSPTGMQPQHLLSPVREPQPPMQRISSRPSASPDSSTSLLGPVRRAGVARRVMLSPESPSSPQSRPVHAAGPHQQQQASPMAPRLRQQARHQPAAAASGEQHLVHPAYRPGVQIPSPQTMHRPMQCMLPGYVQQSGRYDCAPGAGAAAARLVYVPGYGVMPVAPSIASQQTTYGQPAANVQPAPAVQPLRQQHEGVPCKQAAA